MKKIISRGAEAIIYLDKNIIKDRTKKSYRLTEIDERLRGFRTRREAKVISKLNAIEFPCPKLVSGDEKEQIIMEEIKGDKIRDILSEKNYKEISGELGNKIALLHNQNIIHGDLTTSNFILSKKNKKIYFIDFGLSFFSHKIEDKAVDLHLLKQALESKHYKIFDKCFQVILKDYEKNADNGKEIINRLKKVEKRGRYKS